MNIKCFGNDHITSYKLKCGQYNVMFDFNGINMTEKDVKDLDFIFLSHEHMDHTLNLINYDLVKWLNPNVRIFSTATTKKLIQYILKDRMERAGYNKAPYELCCSFIDKIETVFFNKEIVIDNSFSFTLYRSGHTFGSSMVYLKCEDFSLLYTGDIDYVEGDINRMYDLPYNMHIDYMICDGTNLFDEVDYKGVSITNVRDYMKRKKPGTIVKYYTRPEKAVLYALTLADKIDDLLLMYPSSMNWYMKILYDQGYTFGKFKRVFPKCIDFKRWVGPNTKLIEFTADNKNYNLDYKLSLHITKYELNNLIDNHLVNMPKVFIGHYEKTNENKKCDINNSFILKVGDNNE